MMSRILLLLATLSVSAQCLAQTVSVRTEQINPDDVFDVFTIADIAFVVRESAVFNSKKTERNLAKLISPAKAVRIGLPDKSMQQLIDRLLGLPHAPQLWSASAINFGDAGYLWKMKWALFPSMGGFSGIPYEYHAVVRSDGTSVKPELYLCDSYGSLTNSDPAETLFSVLAIDDLLPATSARIDHKNIKQAAEKTFNSARAKFGLPGKFRTLAPQRRKYPRALSTGKPESESGHLDVWAVRFVDSSIGNPKDVKYVGSVIVWVTSDLKTSTLTLGEWAATSIRDQPNARK